MGVTGKGVALPVQSLSWAMIINIIVSPMISGYFYEFGTLNFFNFIDALSVQFLVIWMKFKFLSFKSAGKQALLKNKL